MRSIIILSALLPALTASAVTSSFPDVSRAQESEAVQELVILRKVEGYPDGTFRPRNKVTRAELLTMLLRPANPQPITEPCFPDVPVDTWFAPYVCAGKAEQIVVGYEDGNFRPTATVSVIEALTMLTRAFHLTISPRDSTPWYKRFEDAAHSSGLLPKESYLPTQDLTRGLAAILIYRSLLQRDDSWQEPQKEHWTSGCGATPPSTPPASVRIGEERRPFLLTIPPSYTPRTPQGLIIAFHGRTNNNAQVRDYMGLDRERGDYFIVYPQGVSRTDGSFSWSDGNNSAQTLRDIALFDEIVEEIGSHYCIDRDRIMVAGHSLGAWFASTLSCVRGDVIRGAAVVAPSISPTTCSGPSAAILLHHIDDRLVTFAQGEQTRNEKIEQNMCSQDTKTVWLGGFECLEYTGCRAGNPVVWCPSTIGHGYDGVGQNTHTWPRPAGHSIIEFFDSLSE